MNEVKTPKKPLIYYYGIVLLVLLLFNLLAMPWLSQRQIKEVDYGTFLSMVGAGKPHSLHGQGGNRRLQNRYGGRPKSDPVPAGRGSFLLR